MSDQKFSLFCCMHSAVPPRLCPYMIVPTRLWSVLRHVCDQICLCPDMFVLKHVCAQTCSCPDMFVPIHDCAHMTVVCAQARLGPDMFVPRHV